jgi:SAM-dependent methyltransferase
MVLGAYLDRLVRGRRVAVLGDASLGLGERIAERGARLVHVYDPDAARASEAFAKTSHERTRHVTHAPLEADLGVRDGAFDVVVVPDLSVFPEPSIALRQGRKLVGQTGVCVIASPNPEAHRKLLGHGGAPAPGYYALYDLVSLQFPVVRMLGQAPFVGYTIADFAAGPDLEVSVDTSLLQTTEEPEHFIAVASERKVSIDPFVVVEMPLAQVREALGGPGLSPETLAALADAQSRLAAAQERVRELSAQDQKATEERSAAAIAAAARVVELEAKLEKLRDVDARAGDSHVRAERLSHQIRDLDEELRRQRDRATKLAKQLDDEKKARTKAEVELGLARGRTDAPGAKERIAELTAEVEAARSRALELEGELSAAAMGIEELSSDRAGLRARVAELEVQLAAQAAAAAQPDPATIARITTLEATLDRTEKERRAADKRAEDQGEALANVTRERDHLAEKNQALEKRIAELLAERASAEANAPDIDALEAQLKERGQTIAALERDLRESMRVGKELVAELEALHEAAPVIPEGGEPSATNEPAPTNGAPTALGGASASPADEAAVIVENEAMKAQLDTLAARAARSEADLKAAEWRITQLEHALAAAERGEGEPAGVAVELEQALLAAHQELAALRRVTGAEGGHVMGGVVEQSVLVHQLSNELGRITPSPTNP